MTNQLLAHQYSKRDFDGALYELLRDKATIVNVILHQESGNVTVVYYF